MTLRPTTAPLAALAMAVAGPVAWYLLLAVARPEPVADEVYHVPAIRALAQGDCRPVRSLPMPATYHWLAALPVRLLGGELWVLRAFNVALSALTLIVFWLAASRHDPDGATGRLLRLAWSPLLGPLWVLVYTDAAALLGVAAALAFYVRRRHTWAAAGLLLACLIRQSNVLWLAAFGVLAVIDLRRGRVGDTGGRFRAYAAALGPYGLAMIAAAIFLTGAAFTQPPLMENRPRFNPAQLYMFALTAALLAAPVWLPAFVALWRQRFEPALRRPWVCAAAVGAIGLLELAFRNPHPWNMDLNYLRNWPLYAMTEYAVARYAAAVVIVVLVPTLACLAWQGPRRATLAVIGGVSLLFLAGHYLVDPRYYVIPLVLVDFFTRPTPSQARRLTAWYVVLSLALAAFVGLQPGGWSGVA